MERQSLTAMEMVSGTLVHELKRLSDRGSRLRKLVSTMDKTLFFYIPLDGVSRNSVEKKGGIL